MVGQGPLRSASSGDKWRCMANVAGGGSAPPAAASRRTRAVSPPTPRRKLHRRHIFPAATFRAGRAVSSGGSAPEPPAWERHKSLKLPPKFAELLTAGDYGFGVERIKQRCRRRTTWRRRLQVVERRVPTAGRRLPLRWSDSWASASSTGGKPTAAALSPAAFRRQGGGGGSGHRRWRPQGHRGAVMRGGSCVGGSSGGCWGVPCEREERGWEKGDRSAPPSLMVFRNRKLIQWLRLPIQTEESRFRTSTNILVQRRYRVWISCDVSSVFISRCATGSDFITRTMEVAATTKRWRMPLGVNN